jgi:hypothetical protein
MQSEILKHNTEKEKCNNLVRNMQVDTVEINYNVVRAGYFVPLYTSIVLTEQYNVMANSVELIGAREYTALQAKFLINRRRHNRVLQYSHLPDEEFCEQLLVLYIISGAFTANKLLKTHYSNQQCQIWGTFQQTCLHNL